MQVPSSLLLLGYPFCFDACSRTPTPHPRQGARRGPAYHKRTALPGVGCRRLILIEAPSPADHRGMLRVGKTRLLARRRPQCDFTPHSTHFTVASTCMPV